MTLRSGLGFAASHSTLASTRHVTMVIQASRWIPVFNRHEPAFHRTGEQRVHQSLIFRGSRHCQTILAFIHPFHIKCLTGCDFVLAAKLGGYDDLTL